MYEGTSETVSYTHLDVYKRQVFVQYTFGGGAFSKEKEKGDNHGNNRNDGSAFCAFAICFIVVSITILRRLVVRK